MVKGRNKRPNLVWYDPHYAQHQANVWIFGNRVLESRVQTAVCRDWHRLQLCTFGAADQVWKWCRRLYSKYLPYLLESVCQYTVELWFYRYKLKYKHDITYKREHKHVSTTLELPKIPYLLFGWRRLTLWIATITLYSSKVFGMQSLSRQSKRWRRTLWTSSLCVKIWSRSLQSLHMHERFGEASRLPRAITKWLDRRLMYGLPQDKDIPSIGAWISKL